MADEIIRDGLAYKIGRTYQIIKGQVTGSYQGGEINDSDIDAVIKGEELDAELDEQDREALRLQAEYEEVQKIICKNKSRKKKEKERK